jgi:hypothetical protein
MKDTQKAEIRKGMCEGCPWNYGHPATEMAYNWGCLPSIGEATQSAKKVGKSWACHSEPHKVCCGFAAQEKGSQNRPLYVEVGTHATVENEDK